MEWGSAMTVPILFDPLLPPPGIWDGVPDAERIYIEQMAQAGVPAMVSNVRTVWRALRSGGRVHPVTINDGEQGDSYVCLPHSAYILYGRQELDLVQVSGLMRALFRVVIAGADWLLRALSVNRIVHVDNWLLSTNLHGDWAGQDVAAIRTMLARAYPRHIIAIRSVDQWSCPSLYNSLVADRWLLMPSRQIWVTADLARDWQTRNSTRNDQRKVRALQRSGAVRLEDVEHMAECDAIRIADLYAQLYIGKYSPLNPVFTPRWIAMTHAAGLVQYRVARDGAGQIVAVSGALHRGDVLTPPVVGYDMARPVEDALYRIASLIFAGQAVERGARLNGSAGAAHFKRVRGARPEIEVSGFAIDHLPWPRRIGLRLVGAILNRMIVPFMQKMEL